jgi:hypothetical protein
MSLLPLCCNITCLRFVLAFMLNILSCTANAMTDGPMRFETFQPCMGNASFCATQVLARGVIQLDSGEQLANFLAREAVRDKYFNSNPTIVFDSPGGSLAGGIALGRVIRSRKLNTLIEPEYIEEKRDDSHPDGYRERVIAKDVICASACSLAFIGGSVRGIAQGAKLGVHQFTSSTGSMSGRASQVAVTALAAYVIEMGVDRRMIDLASVTSSNDILWIDASKARELRIDNTVAPLNEWKVTVDQVGIPTVQVLQEIKPGHNLFLFLRASSEGVIRLFMVSRFERQIFDAGRLQFFPLDKIPDIRIAANVHRVVRLQAKEPWRFKLDKEEGFVSFMATAPLTANDIEILRQASTLEISDGFPIAIMDMRVETQISTKNLSGGIGLLLRSK